MREQEIRRAIERACRRARAGRLVVLVLPVPDDDEKLPDFDKEWKISFLDWLRKGRTVKAAAELSGVTKRHANRTYHRDPRFAEAWDEIRRSHRDVPQVPPRRAYDDVTDERHE